MEHGKVVDEFEQLIAIPGEVPPVVSALTHIHATGLAGKPTMDGAREEILSHIGEDALIVGQNVSFDIGMLKGEGIDLSARAWIDTSMLASLVYPELESYSLGYISRVLKLRHDPVHRALGDVHATMELLGHTWERLLTITEDLEIPLRSIMDRAPEGYRRFFAALPKAETTDHPMWLMVPKPTPKSPKKKVAVPLEMPSAGTVELLEEPLSPHVLFHVIDEAVRNGGNHLIATKNLHATLRAFPVPRGVGIIHPPSRMLDHSAVEKFALQEIYTADEATLALKLAWYEPRLTDDLPLHGEERTIWQGKLACTVDSAPYREQFSDIPPVTLLSHWELLAIAADKTHPGQVLFKNAPHVIIDDASLLEDTATRAYGSALSIDNLRAAATGNTPLSAFTDLLQIWVEKTRRMQDLIYITSEHLDTQEAKGLRRQLVDLLGNTSLPRRTQELLKSVQAFFDNALLPDRITWIETRQNGSQFAESVPGRIGDLLQEHLFKRTPTTLLIPPGSATTLREILPTGTETHVQSLPQAEKMPLSFIPDMAMEHVILEPMGDKVVVLMGSRSRIEDIFVRYSELADRKGITLICQSMSGGLGRMQAEFLACSGPVVWVMTPWTFEGVELSAGVLDHLVIESLPFDHPSHAVLSKRAEHYRSAFGEYTLPRLQHRLYRLLRTFSLYQSGKGGVTFLDQRLDMKDYGKTTWAYLRSLTGTESAVNQEEVAMKPAPKPEEKKEVKKKEPKKKKKSSSAKGKSEAESQLSLFNGV
jgi:DNA polymerase III epsilon subunit-like protein/Rad3-related DNA helicase